MGRFVQVGADGRETPLDFAFVKDGGPSDARLGLLLEWVPERSALQHVSADRLSYRFRDFDYAVGIGNGVAAQTSEGARIVAGKRGARCLLLAQAA